MEAKVVLEEHYICIQKIHIIEKERRRRKKRAVEPKWTNEFRQKERVFCVSVRYAFIGI